MLFSYKFLFQNSTEDQSLAAYDLSNMSVEALFQNMWLLKLFTTFVQYTRFRFTLYLFLNIRSATLKFDTLPQTTFFITLPNTKIRMAFENYMKSQFWL